MIWHHRMQYADNSHGHDEQNCGGGLLIAEERHLRDLSMKYAIGESEFETLAFVEVWRR
jgi:hypothetical protein